MISTPLTDALLRGHDHSEATDRGLRPHRIPAWVTEQFPDPQLVTKGAHPAGVRVAMTTAATVVELVTHTTRLGYGGIARERGAVDLVVDHELLATDPLDGGDLLETDLQTGETVLVEDAPHTSRFTLPAGEHLVELWLPHSEAVELVDLRTDAPVEPAPVHGRRWLHHGSSVSQGSNAVSPAQTWPALAARLGGVDLRNLGVGGSALVDPFMARVMRDTPADLISVKLGINVVNSDAMRLRAFVPAVHGFLDTIRDGHPDDPLLLVSPTHCRMQEHTPGPITFDRERLAAGDVGFVAADPAGTSEQGRLTLSVVRDALASVVAERRDPNLHYLNGIGLYGEADEDRHPLPDGLHPDTASHELIGTRFAERVFAADGAFGPA